MNVERPFAKGIVVSALAAVATAAFVATAGLVVGQFFACLLAFAGLAALHGVGIVARALATPRERRVRVIARDLALTALGLVLAASLLGPGLFGLGLAVWAFGLVQCFALVGPAPRSHAPAAPDDAFEAARGRALAILDELE